MNRTVDRIVAASKLPLSIVIVGVGGADFSNMVSEYNMDDCTVIDLSLTLSPHPFYRPSPYCLPLLFPSFLPLLLPPPLPLLGSSRCR